MRVVDRDARWPPSQPLYCPECAAECSWRPDPPRGPAVVCPRCRWYDDLFGWCCAVSGLCPAIVLSQLVACGCPSARNVGGHVLRTYETARERRTKHRVVGDTLDERTLGTPCVTTSALGLNDVPCNPPYWGQLTQAEAGQLWEASAPRRTQSGMMGTLFGPLPPGEDRRLAGEPITAVPEEDRPGRRCGFWLFGPLGRVSTTDGRCGIGPGFGFLGTRAARTAAWGDAAVIAVSASSALVAHGQQARTCATRVMPLLAIEQRDVVPSATWLPERPYVFLVGSSEVVGSVVRLAARLDARVMFRFTGLPPDVPPDVSIWSGSAGAESWGNYVNQTLAGKTDLGVTTFAAGFGSDPEGMGLLKRALSPAVYSRILAVTDCSPNPAVTVTARCTVEAADGAWYWREQGTVLLDAVPRVARVYRRGRKVHHAGVVRFRGVDYPFDSAVFRRDPVGTIERALLKGAAPGTAVVHPTVCARIADLALYFCPPEQRE